MKRYYKIGELVKLYGIGRDAIKYYEELDILKPSRDTNGYRIYNIDDVCKLNLIRELRNLNIPMKEIKKYLEKRSIKSTKNMLEEELNIISKNIDILVKQRKNIENRINVINEGMNKTEFGKVSIDYLDKRKALAVDGNVSTNENIDYIIQKLRKKLEESFYILGNNNIASIFDSESIENGVLNKYKKVIVFLDENSDINNFLLEEGYYLSCSYKGTYENNKKYLEKIFDYAKKNNLNIVSDPIEIYEVDIYETSKVSEFITNLQVRVKKT